MYICICYIYYIIKLYCFIYILRIAIPNVYIYINAEFNEIEEKYE